MEKLILSALMLALSGCGPTATEKNIEAEKDEAAIFCVAQARARAEKVLPSTVPHFAGIRVAGERAVLLAEGDYAVEANIYLYTMENMTHPERVLPSSRMNCRVTNGKLTQAVWVD